MLAQLKHGNPSLPPLIFLHGFLGCKEDWNAMIPYFERDYYCIALDLPGHGSSLYSEDIVGAIKNALPEKPILIGYSMGGRIAMQLQEHAEKVVNISGHPGLKTNQEKQARLVHDTKWSQKLRELPFEQFLEEWYQQSVFADFGPSLLKLRKNQNPYHLAQVMLQMSLGNQSAIQQFLPDTLFIFGEKDWKYRTLFSNFVSCVDVRMVKNSGHAVHIENPAECGLAILNWLNAHANR